MRSMARLANIQLLQSVIEADLSAKTTADFVTHLMIKLVEVAGFSLA
jgi:hypothetical protein